MSSSMLLTIVWILIGLSIVYGQRWGAVRLVGGADDSQGRVEVFTKNEWGTVCHDYWGQQEGKVVCRQLGYTNLESTTVHLSALFGAGSGLIHLDDLHCAGMEEDLLQCTHNGVGIHDCGHSQDAGVACFCDPAPVCEKPEGDCPYFRTEIVSVADQPQYKVEGRPSKKPCPICRCASCPDKPKCPQKCKSGKTEFYQGDTCRRCRCRPQELPEFIVEPNEISLGMMLAVVVVMFVIPVISLIVVCILKKRQDKAFKEATKAKAKKDGKNQRTELFGVETV